MVPNQSPADAGTGAITGRVHKAQKRRREILDAAARVFYEKGYDASSTQDIAEAVGILKGSLYYYVDSKEQFLFEIIKEAHDLGLQILDEIQAAEGDVVTRFTLLIHRHVEYFAANLIKVNVFFREFQALSPERRKDIDKLGHMYRQCVEDLVREGQAEGHISDSIDPTMAGIMIVEMLNSIARWYHASGRATPDQIADQAATILLGGLTTPLVRDELGGENALRSRLVQAPTPVKRAHKSASRKAATRTTTSRQVAPKSG